MTILRLNRYPLGVSGLGGRSVRRGRHPSRNYITRAVGTERTILPQLYELRPDCGDVLLQLAAAEKAVHRVSELVLENHLHTCVVDKVRQGDDAVVDEAMDLIRKFGSR